MATVPVINEFADGVLTASQLNQVRTAFRYLASVPIADVRQSSAQSIPTAVWTALQFPTEDVDTDIDRVGGHDTVTNNTRYTARYPGWYQFSGGVGFVANTTGVRGTQWAVNGTALAGSQTLVNATSSFDANIPARTRHIYLYEGDYVELNVFQNSGAGLNSSSTAATASNMSARWVSN